MRNSIHVLPLQTGRPRFSHVIGNASVAMPLTLTADQHKLLGHALALAHALHSEMAGNGLGVAPGELPAVYDDVDIYVQPGAHGGAGFFSTLGDAVASGANPVGVKKGIDKTAAAVVAMLAERARLTLEIKASIQTYLAPLCSQMQYFVGYAYPKM